MGNETVIDLTRRRAAYNRAIVTTTVSPKRSRDVTVMGRGSADEAVVVVKLEAYEDAVTYRRVKLSASGRKMLEAKGGTCNRDIGIHL